MSGMIYFDDQGLEVCRKPDGAGGLCTRLSLEAERSMWHTPCVWLTDAQALRLASALLKSVCDTCPTALAELAEARAEADWLRGMVGGASERELRQSWEMTKKARAESGTAK